MKNNSYLILITLITLNFTIAQNYFTGSVIESDTRDVVSDALVTIEKTALTKKTAVDGRFNFYNNIPVGEHVVTIEKEGYDTEFLLINITQGKTVKMDSIPIKVNKNEKARRAKLIKEEEKKRKDLKRLRAEKLANAQKEKEKKEKLIEKERRRLKKLQKKKAKDAIVVRDAPPSIPNNSGNLSALQAKYSTLLGVAPEAISNQELYKHIDEWYGTAYKLGGETKDGIDCSSLTQQIYSLVYNKYIERTAEKQFKSKFTDEFSDKNYLTEGDLVFFRGTGKNENIIVHVGLYLDNNKFVHSTSYKKDTGSNGVKIGDLNNKYWKRLFVAGGKRTDK